MRKTRFREPSIPCENTVIKGISKLKGWPVLETQYFGFNSMKLKKFNAILKSIISTLQSEIAHADNVFHILRFVYQIEKFLKNVVNGHIHKF